MFAVPRREKLPAKELEICRRLRSFREGTRVPRTVFAAEAGVVGSRLLNCELGVTPLSYGLFRALNRKYFVNPDWLVNGNEPASLGCPLPDSFEEPPINPRELISAVWEERKIPRSVMILLSLAESARQRSGAIWEAAPQLKKLIDSDAFNELPPEKGAKLSASAQRLLASWEAIMESHEAMLRALDKDLPQR